MLHRISAFRLRFVALVLFGVVGLLPVSDLWADDDKKVDAKLVPSHKQTHVIRPELDGEKVTLNTFCLDRDGNILACVGGASAQPVQNEDGTIEYKKTERPQALQFYAPDGKLIRQVALTFRPTAVSQSPQGTIFVAGSGKLASFTADGEPIATADAPHLGDMEQLRKEAEEDAKEQMKQLTSSFTEAVEKIDARIKKLEAKPEAERTEREKRRLATAIEQRDSQKKLAEEMETSYASMFNVESMLENRLTITSIAANSSDLFVCCGGKGYGYEVWRVNHEFAAPEKVVEGLSGCCGQCDIQATDQNLVVAANTKFAIELLDRDGKPVSRIENPEGKAAFGSCCNPMNVRCCDNGDILAAESSIGWIKRFNKDGEFVGTVGKARIGGGCKHVPIGHDAKLDRYYMMYQDRSEICVLVPKDEAPEMTEEELEAKKAREGLGQKLVGAWKMVEGSAEMAGAIAVEEAASGEAANSEAAGTDASGGDSAPANDGEAGTETVQAIPAMTLQPATKAGAAGEEEAGAEGQSAPAIQVIPAVELRRTDVEESDEANDEQEPSGEDDSSDMEEEDAEAMMALNALDTGSMIPGELKFEADGKLSAKGSFHMGGGLTWEAVRQEGNVLTVAQMMDGVSSFDMVIEFRSDDEIKMDLMMGEQKMGSLLFRRETTADESAAASSAGDSPENPQSGAAGESTSDKAEEGKDK